MDHGWAGLAPGHGTAFGSLDLWPVARGTNRFGFHLLPACSCQVPGRVSGWTELPLDHGRVRLVTELLQGPQSGSSSVGLLPRVPIGMGPPRFFGEWDWWQDCAQAELELSSQGYRCSSLQVHSWDITGDRPDIGVRTCLIKVALLSLGFHWGFPIFCLDPKVRQKAFLFVGGCQILFLWGNEDGGMAYSTFLLTSLPVHDFILWYTSFN